MGNGTVSPASVDIEGDGFEGAADGGFREVDVG